MIHYYNTINLSYQGFQVYNVERNLLLTPPNGWIPEQFLNAIELLNNFVEDKAVKLVY